MGTMKEGKRLLKKAQGATPGDANLMFPLLIAIRSFATPGEIPGAVKEIFGEYKSTSCTRYISLGIKIW